ncbi:hypothetical protein R1flu_020990 [Riccia fluitans]|uniref:Uncharacterized protein n=1 Tax=Riccia fluitans TaxID=41844 RepID=A0ABD1ZN30_9MARC
MPRSTTLGRTVTIRIHGSVNLGDFCLPQAAGLREILLDSSTGSRATASYRVECFSRSAACSLFPTPAEVQGGSWKETCVRILFTGLGAMNSHSQLKGKPRRRK